MFVIQNSLIMGILYAFLYSLRFPISFYLSNSGVFYRRHITSVTSMCNKAYRRQQIAVLVK